MPGQVQREVCMHSTTQPVVQRCGPLQGQMQPYLRCSGGCFDRLRSKPRWKDINAYTVIAEECISDTLLPKNQWDIPFDGWINEKGVFQINN